MMQLLFFLCSVWTFMHPFGGSQTGVVFHVFFMKV